MALRKRLAGAAMLAAAMILLILLTSGFWLSAFGRALVNDQQARRADAAFVLAGDQRGNRIMKACSLVRDGVVPVVLVSGPMEMYGVNEADLAIRQGVRRGCAQQWLQPVYMQALSTEEEATRFHDWLRGHPEIRSVLLVTSNFHTARAFRTFRREIGSDVRLIPVAAPDPYFTENGWWRNREGQKTFFFEASKTVASWIGL